MKHRSLIIAGTIAWGSLLAGVHVHGQSNIDLGSRPTRLPIVSKGMLGNAAEGMPEAIIEVVTTRTTNPDSVIAPPAVVRPWLQSTTAMASSAKARQKFEQAKVEFHSKAWLSAEQSAWQSISLFSQAIDLRGSGVDAVSRFRIAKVAIEEARDFGNADATADSATLFRLAKSHRTNLITKNDAAGLTAATAADRYLDLARRNLSPIAAQDPRCAEAIDFLAAVYLGRGEPKQLPSETALCLRRAALQGQPVNADLAARLGMQLADVGLVDEAKWAMEHSLQIQFQPVIANRLAKLMQQTGQEFAADQWKEQVAVRSRFREGVAKESTSVVASHTPSINKMPPIAIPVIAQLSPSEFASVSKPVMQETTQSNVLLPGSKTVVPVSFVSTRLDELNQSLHEKPATPPSVAEAETPKVNPVRRWFQSIKTPWQSPSK